MTVQELVNHLSNVPKDARIISISGWECCETDIGGIWYSKSRNEVHLTQGGCYERERGYLDDFEMIFCKDGY